MTKVNKATKSQFMVSMKGLVTRNAHLEYESLTSSGYEDMTKVEVFHK